ncbi:MAG: molybdenum ABC transporter ATP-binding protein [Syntrophotaleaceae bacterium]
MNLYLSLEKTFGTFRFDAAFRTSAPRIGLLGRSGSGKSTLVNLLAGMMTPDRGRIQVDDEVLYDSSKKIAVPPEKRRIAVVFQQAHLFPHMNVRRNLFFGLRRIPAQKRHIDPEALFRVLDIDRLLDRRVTSLSGGEKQRVALGRAVLAHPRLLLMDEPLNGLDEALKYQVIPYLNEVVTRFRIPLLYISHSMNEMRMMTDEVVVLDSGRVVSQTSAESVARLRMQNCPMGYQNFFRLCDPVEEDGLFRYRWGGNQLLLTQGCSGRESLFTLSSKDIVLFRRHPESVSARNLLLCRVKGIIEMENRVGLELETGGESVVAQVVKRVVSEWELGIGSEVFACIKADAFRRLY